MAVALCLQSTAKARAVISDDRRNPMIILSPF